MNPSLTKNQLLMIFGIPLGILLLLTILAGSSLFRLHPDILSFGITADLVMTIPLVYLISIRKCRIPKTTVIPVLIVGIILGGMILPSAHQHYLGLAKIWLLPAAELTAILLIIVRVRKSIHSFQHCRLTNPDFYTALRKTVADLLPSGLGHAFATEIAVFYYGIFNWKKNTIAAHEFTYHKQSGTVAMLWVLIFLVLAESLVVHILIYPWNALVAWIITSVSLYSALQLIGFTRSITRRPVCIEGGMIYIRYGILAECSLAFENIDYVELTTKPLSFDRKTRRLSPLGELDSYNVVIHMKEEVTLMSLYGVKRTFINLAFHIDQPREFLNIVSEHLNKG